MISEGRSILILIYYLLITYSNNFFLVFIFHIIQVSMVCVDLTYYRKNRDKILAKNRSYYYANRDKLKEKRDNQSEEKKNKLKEYYKECGVIIYQMKKKLKEEKNLKIGIDSYQKKKKLKNVNILKRDIEN